MIVHESDAPNMACPVAWPSGPIRCRGSACMGWGWADVVINGPNGGYGYCRMGSRPDAYLTPKRERPSVRVGLRNTVLTDEIGVEGF